MMKLSEKNIVNIIVIALVLISFFTGWILYPFFVKNIIIRNIFSLISLAIPLLYFVNLISIKVKSNLFSTLSAIIIFIFLAFPFRAIYSDLVIGNTPFYLFFLIIFFLNGAVLYFDSFQKDISNIDNTLVLMWDSIIYGGILLGSLMLFQLINGTVNPPWNELTNERKFFFLFRITYYFIISLFAYKIKNSNNKNESFKSIYISIITLLFIFYCFYTYYLKVNTNYLSNNLTGFLRELLCYLMMSFLLIYSIQILNFKSKYSLNNSIIKVYKFVLICFSILIVAPLALLFLSKYVEFISDFFNSKQDSVIVIIISSISTSVISNLIIKYFISKQIKENPNNETVSNKE